MYRDCCSMSSIVMLQASAWNETLCLENTCGGVIKRRRFEALAPQTSETKLPGVLPRTGKHCFWLHVMTHILGGFEVAHGRQIRCSKVAVFLSGPGMLSDDGAEI